MRTDKPHLRNRGGLHGEEDHTSAQPPPPYAAAAHPGATAGPSTHTLNQVSTTESDAMPPEVKVPWETQIKDGKVQVECDDFQPPQPAGANAGAQSYARAMGYDDCPPLNIVMFVVGDRGDVQPYVALALQLIVSKGHRVRIATHAEFAELVAEASVRLAGLTDTEGAPLTGHMEHYDIGGVPAQVMQYMVGDKGELLGAGPRGGESTLVAKRKFVKQTMRGCYRACFMPCESSGVPFAADAIISNPVAVGNIHIAEALGLPLTMSYVMPWTPTVTFPHPLVTLANTHDSQARDNYSSYFMADILLYQGLGDVINDFRIVTLGLPALSLLRIPEVVRALGVPWTYAWSERLLSQPQDWEGHNDVVGFFFVPPSSRAPRISQELFEFLADGKPPIYFGFGSTPIQDPERLTDTILAAVKETGVRAILHATWLDAEVPSRSVSQAVFVMREALPHSWLFAEGRVSAVCHHGGAGTTAASLKQGLPTIVIPFLGDQYLWGQAVYSATAGPRPLPANDLTPSRLAELIRAAHSPEIRAGAARLGTQLSRENGTVMGEESFYRHLPLGNMMCQVDPTQAARWWCQEFCVKVSNVAAAVIVESKFMSWRSFTPYRPIEYNTGGYYRDPRDSLEDTGPRIGAQTMSGSSQLYTPAKEFSDSLIGIPKASFDIIGQIQEGFDNVPGYFGADVRRRGKVDSLRSGVKEGAKGFAYGLADGLTGLVTEPVKGAKEGGLGGAISGTITGSINLAARVTGGALGIVTQPTAGLFRSARKTLARHGAVEARSVFCDPREHAAHAEATKLGTQERRELLAAWERVTGSYNIKERMRQEKERVAALEQHFRSGGSSSRGDRPSRSNGAGSERRSSWGSDLGRRGSLGSVVSRMKGKGKERADRGSNVPNAESAETTHSAAPGVTSPGQRHPGPSDPYRAYPREQRIPGSYDSYATDEQPEPMSPCSSYTSPRGEKGGLPQTRHDSRVSLNSGMDVALAGTGDRWWGSTSSLGGMSTLTASITGRSGRDAREDSPLSPEIRGRSLGQSKGKEKEKQKEKR